MNLVAMSSNALTQEVWRCVWGTSRVQTLVTSENKCGLPVGGSSLQWLTQVYGQGAVVKNMQPFCHEVKF